MFLFIMLSGAIFLILLSIACSGRGIYLMRKKQPHQKMFRLALIFLVLAIACYFAPLARMMVQGG